MTLVPLTNKSFELHVVSADDENVTSFVMPVVPTIWFVSVIDNNGPDADTLTACELSQRNFCESVNVMSPLEVESAVVANEDAMLALRCAVIVMLLVVAVKVTGDPVPVNTMSVTLLENTSALPMSEAELDALASTLLAENDAVPTVVLLAVSKTVPGLETTTLPITDEMLCAAVVVLASTPVPDQLT